jgi:hypothetical protein
MLPEGCYGRVGKWSYARYNRGASRPTWGTASIVPLYPRFNPWDIILGGLLTSHALAPAAAHYGRGLGGIDRGHCGSGYWDTGC